jgi:hypothetical protein
MTLKYKIALTIYTTLIIGLLGFLLMWALGMNEKSKLAFSDYLTILFVFLHIIFLGILTSQKNKIVFSAVNLIALLISIAFVGFFIYNMDWGFETITFTILYAYSVSILFIHNLKNIQSK